MFDRSRKLMHGLHTERFDVSRRARNLRMHAWVACAIAAPIYAAFAVANQVLYTAPIMAAPPAVASILAVLALLLLRYRRHPTAAGHLFTAALSVQVFGEMFFNGGLQAPAAALSLMIIPAAIVTAGARAALVWAMSTIGALATIGVLDVFGALPANALDGNALLLDRVFSLVAGMIVCAALVLLFERQAASAIETLERERAAYRHQAMHDGLTGMPNRTCFNDHAQAAIDKAKDGLTGCILFYFDIDRFKQINDQLGHAVGDELLQAFSARLSERVRPGDLAARLAGDEFAMIVDADDEVPAADHVLQRLRSITANPFVLDGRPVDVGMSIGYASFPLDGDDLDTLMRVADVRMYDDKSARRQAGAGLESTANVVPLISRAIQPAVWQKTNR